MKITPQQSDKIKDKYLKKNNAGYWTVVIALLILLLGMLSWLLFGSYNLTVTGYADVVAGISNNIYVSAEDVDKVDLGMSVIIGNSRGKINFINKNYYTYDDLVAMYGRTVKYLHVSPEKSYYEVISDIVTDETGYIPYTIIYKSVSPMEYFFGRN